MNSLVNYDIFMASTGIKNVCVGVLFLMYEKSYSKKRERNVNEKDYHNISSLHTLVLKLFFPVQTVR